MRAYNTQKDDTNGHHVLTDRVQMIIFWLVNNRSLINNTENLQITFNCAGKSVNAELKQRHQVPQRSYLAEEEFKELVRSLK